jgi:hypothetical protein
VHTFNGLPIIVTASALKESDERLFPPSRNRSKRIHKKLVKRFGGEYRKVPAIWQCASGLFVHPTMYEELKQELARRNALGPARGDSTP